MVSRDPWVSRKDFQGLTGVLWNPSFLYLFRPDRHILKQLIEAYYTGKHYDLDFREIFSMTKSTYSLHEINELRLACIPSKRGPPSLCVEPWNRSIISWKIRFKCPKFKNLDNHSRADNNQKLHCPAKQWDAIQSVKFWYHHDPNYFPHCTTQVASLAQGPRLGMSLKFLTFS